MEIYRVSFIGHRRLYKIRQIEDRLEEIIRQLIRSKEYVEFYVGRNGDFDICVGSAVKRVQEELGKQNSCLILVLPYPSKDQEYFEKYYDELCLPVDGKTHYKAAITKRNEWLVDNSDMLIAYVENQSGGAYKTIKYAEKNNVPITNIANKLE